MKYTSLTAFERHLQEAAPQHFAPVYLIVSKDAFDQKEAERRLVRFLVDDNEKALKVFEGGKTSINAVVQELNSLTLFAERRIVLIHHAEKLSKPVTDQLEKYFARPSKSVFLVILASTITRTTKFYKNAEKVGVVLDLAEEKLWKKENALVQKIIERLQVLGKSIDEKTCRYLLKYVGVEQFLVHQELEKLVCYVGDKERITEKDVCAICAGVNTENVWQMGDAIFRRDAKAALRIVTTMLAEGLSFFSLIRQIRTQFQTKFQVCALLATGGGPENVQRQFPYMKGNILQQNMQTARSYGLQRFSRGMLLIDETELLAKNSGLPHELLMERLMIKLTTS